MIVSKYFKINAGGTIDLYVKAQTVLTRIQFLVATAGTSWSIQFQDQSSDHAIVFGPWTAAVSSDGAPYVLDYARQDVCMGIPIAGLSFKTLSGTPGLIYLWASLYQPSTGP